MNLGKPDNCVYFWKIKITLILLTVSHTLNFVMWSAVIFSYCAKFLLTTNPVYGKIDKNKVKSLNIYLHQFLNWFSIIYHIHADYYKAIKSIIWNRLKYYILSLYIIL